MKLFFIFAKLHTKIMKIKTMDSKDIQNFLVLNCNNNENDNDKRQRRPVVVPIFYVIKSKMNNKDK